MANPFPTVSNTVGSLAAGHIVLATEWNSAVGGLYTYINNTLLAANLNKMAAKGDIYVFDGTNMQVISTGGAANDNKVLSANSAAALGVSYAAIASTALLTTKGDQLGFAANLVRIPIGADATVWTADSTNANGAAWKVPAPGTPVGGIILWSQAIGSIPTGFNLCDGGTYNGITTPNMQGVYLVGAGTGVNPPAASGMGNLAVNTPGGDAANGAAQGPAHTHGIGTVTGVYGTTTSANVAVLTSVGPVTTAVITPRYNTLFFIMRTI